MLIINEDFLGIGLHTCGSAEDYRYIVEKSNEKIERIMGPFIDFVSDKFITNNNYSSYNYSGSYIEESNTTIETNESTNREESNSTIMPYVPVLWYI